MRVFRFASVAGLLILMFRAAPAQAFHEVSSFARSANTGGGANRYYSGSPRSKGYDCSICHVDAEGRIAIELNSDLRAGTYSPGLIYPITVRLIGEHRGLDSAFNPNTFTAEMVGADGMPLGRMAGGSSSGVELRDLGAVAIAEGFGNGENEWSFSWWAPEEGSAATLYIAMLDGDGASDPVNRFIDPLQDDVATLKLSLCPDSQLCPAPALDPEPSSPAGCRVVAGDSPIGLLGFVLVLWLLRRAHGLCGP